MDVIGLALIAIGTAFTVLGVIGVFFRLKDVYERLHGTGKVGTLGLITILAGVAFLQPGVTFKVVVLIIFLVLTAPAAAHAISSAAHAQGLKPSGRDDLEVHKKQSKNI